MVPDVFILQGGAGDDWIFSLVDLVWGGIRRTRRRIHPS